MAIVQLPDENTVNNILFDASLYARRPKNTEGRQTILVLSLNASFLVLFPKMTYYSHFPINPVWSLIVVHSSLVKLCLFSVISGAKRHSLPFI